MIEIILFVVLVIYVVFILQLIIGFEKVKSFVRTDEKPKTAFTIIVPFRNEEKQYCLFCLFPADWRGCYPSNQCRWARYHMPTVLLTK